MDATLREALLLRSTLPKFRRRVEQAQEIIRACLERAANPYVAFSAGKDSTVVLHLVRSIAPDTVAHFGHEEWLLPETDALIAATGNVIKSALPDTHAEWFSAWQDPARVPDDVQYIDPAQYTEFNYARKKFGWDGVFLGLRADENGRRRLHLRSHGLLFFAQNYQVWQCNPIGWWTVEDVWAYILSRGVDYNRAYDVLAGLGLPLREQRVGPLAVERAIGYGQLAILRRGWPQLYAAFVAKYPEAASYT